MIRNFFLLITALLLPAAGIALTSDRDQPISIEADSAYVDDTKGITIYEGNALIQQGTLNISADKVKVIMSNSEVIEIIASMKQTSEGLAHYEQVPDDNEDLVAADAKMITYFIQEERLHLAGDAHLQQTRDKFSGELLYYNMTTGVVELKGGKKSDNKTGRVSITLQPKKRNP
jgi:lipopolysaccharide export system protein LptA